MKFNLVSSIVMITALVMGTTVFAAGFQAGNILNGQPVEISNTSGIASYFAKKQDFKLTKGKVKFICLISGKDKPEAVVTKGKAFGNEFFGTTIKPGKTYEFNWSLHGKDNVGNIKIEYKHGKSVKAHCIAIRH